MERTYLDVFEVFEKRVARRIICPKTEEVTEGWRNLHYESLHKLLYSPDMPIRMMKLVRGDV